MFFEPPFRYKRTPPTKACESRARNKLQNVHKTRAPPLCELVLKASIRARAYSHARKFLIPTLTAPPPFLPGHVLNGRNNPGLKWPDSGRRKGGRAPVGQAVRRVLGPRRPRHIIQFLLLQDLMDTKMVRRIRLGEHLFRLQMSREICIPPAPRSRIPQQ